MKLYDIIRPFARFSLKIYFRKVFVHGLEHVPRKGPLIIAANHPSAFMEACILACFQPRPIYFLVRGDVFVNPVINFLLDQTNQIPIYRFRDGFKNLRNNESTFSKSYDLLNAGKPILIFSEGITKFEKKLKPLQKGTAKLAFGTYDKHQSDELKILPVGINYTDVKRMRSEVMVEIGEPLLLKDYLDEYQVNNHDGIKRLTADLYQAMQKLVIHVDNPEDEYLLDELTYYHCPDELLKVYPVVDKSSSFYQHQFTLAGKLNQMTKDHKDALREKLQSNPLPVGARQWPLKYFQFGLWLARGLNWLPYKLTTLFANNKVTAEPFYGPVFWGIGSLFYLIYLLLIGIIGSIWLGLFGWIIALLVFLLGMYYFQVTDVFRNRARQKRIQRILADSDIQLIFAKSFGPVESS